MLPLLATVAMALVSNQMKAAEERRNRLREIARNKADTLRAISDRRAARAGDSMYMQSSIGGMPQLPARQHDGSVLMGVGQALLGSESEPDAVGAGAGAGAGADSQFKLDSNSGPAPQRSYSLSNEHVMSPTDAVSLGGPDYNDQNPLYRRKLGFGMQYR